MCNIQSGIIICRIRVAHRLLYSVWASLPRTIIAGVTVHPNRPPTRTDANRWVLYEETSGSQHIQPNQENHLKVRYLGLTVRVGGLVRVDCDALHSLDFASALEPGSLTCLPKSYTSNVILYQTMLPRILVL